MQSYSMYPAQSLTMPAAVGAAQTTGIDISGIMGMIMPLMIVGMMGKMMTGMMGTKSPKPLKAA